MADPKPNVLILGGSGFIGRNLVKYLCEEKLVGKIRVADKTMPALAYLAPHFKAFYDDKSIVEFKQCDLAQPKHVERAFADEKFDYVVNLCGETRFGLPDDEYKLKSVSTALGCATAAEEAKVQKWVEVSTAQVYDAQKKSPTTESSLKIKPWTLVAKNRLEVEQKLAATSLPMVVLRPSTVYGEGDLTGLTPRIVCAAVYKHKKEKMKFLWDKSLRINTVHVDDLARAIWVACTELPAGKTYNVSDPADTDQGTFNGILGKIFGIDVGFLGSTMSTVATKISLAAVAAEANDKHVPSWTKMCTDAKVNTHLSPYIDKELLSNNSLCIDGSAITRDSTFTYTIPAPTQEIVEDLVRKLIAQGYFPAILD